MSKSPRLEALEEFQKGLSRKFGNGKVEQEIIQSEVQVLNNIHRPINIQDLNQVEKLISKKIFHNSQYSKQPQRNNAILQNNSSRQSPYLRKLSPNSRIETPFERSSVSPLRSVNERARLNRSANISDFIEKVPDYDLKQIVYGYRGRRLVPNRTQDSPIFARNTGTFSKALQTNESLRNSLTQGMRLQMRNRPGISPLAMDKWGKVYQMDSIRFQAEQQQKRQQDLYVRKQHQQELQEQIQLQNQKREYQKGKRFKERLEMITDAYQHKKQMEQQKRQKIELHKEMQRVNLDMTGELMETKTIQLNEKNKERWKIQQSVTEYEEQEYQRQQQKKKLMEKYKDEQLKAIKQQKREKQKLKRQEIEAERKQAEERENQIKRKEEEYKLLVLQKAEKTHNELRLRQIMAQQFDEEEYNKRIDKQQQENNEKVLQQLREKAKKTQQDINNHVEVLKQQMKEQGENKQAFKKLQEEQALLWKSQQEKEMKEDQILQNRKKENQKRLKQTYDQQVQEKQELFYKDCELSTHEALMNKELLEDLDY